MAIPLSPSPSSSSSLLPQRFIFPNFPQRIHFDIRLFAHLPTRRLQHSSNGEQQRVWSPPKPEVASDPMETKETATVRKKKKRQKPRPSFYDQTVERWSVRVSSQRSKFPWQKEPAEPPSPKAAVLIAPERSAENLAGARSGSELNFENPGRGLRFSGAESSKGGSFDDDGVPVGVRRGAAPWVPLGNGRAAAPWVHGTNLKLALEIDGDDQMQTGSIGREESVSNSNASRLHINDDGGDEEEEEDETEERHSLNGSSSCPSMPEDEKPTQCERLAHGKSSVSFVVDELRNSLDQSRPSIGIRVSLNESAKVVASNLSGDVVKFAGTVRLPWERQHSDGEGERSRRRSNTELAEKTVPELELRRLRNVALRMKERIKVGAAGVTEALVESIHKKWKEEEVVKLWFEGPPTLHMKKTHEILERKTGGLVIWRSGSSMVLYRGMAYELPCARSYAKLADTGSDHKTLTLSEANDVASRTANVGKSFSANSPEQSSEGFDIDSFLDQLGPRYKDWSGCNPLPVDADLLPGLVPGYKPPFRLLPYKTRSGLKNRQMTSLRRLARTMSPHFVLGRNRQHQGLARAMVKLWEKSALAKIAIKRGVPNTSNERMAEEIKKLTGGVLLSRNKEYIVFYRGNDFVSPTVREVLMEKQNLAIEQQDEEEAARLRASSTVSNAKTAKRPLLAGTLAETLEANARWGHQPSTEERDQMKKDLAVANHASLVRYLERKLELAKAKVRKAERALAKVQELLDPAELPTDLETVTDEERSLFRNMGLKMRAYLPLGRRGIFDGTVQNIHLNWKHRELAKILVKGKTFALVKHIAISLEAETGGVLISLDKTTKGYAIVLYRGKNYQRPSILRPKNLLTKRQALARAIELQRREALKHHISNLHERIQLLKSQLDNMEADNDSGNEQSNLQKYDALNSDDEVEDEGEEAYLETYSSNDEDGDGA